MHSFSCPVSTLVLTTALAMANALQGTSLLAESTVNVTSIGKERPVTSLTAETTAAAQTMAIVTSQGRSCVCAMIAGKVSLSTNAALSYAGVE